MMNKDALLNSGIRRLFLKTKNNVGLTLMEVLIVIGFIALLFILTIVTLNGFGSRSSLDTAALEVASVLQEARANTLAGLNNTVYGVHFTSSSVTLFRGDTYSFGDPNNQVTELSSQVQISSIALQGGGNDVVFQRLTGKASVTGTVTLQLTADGTKTKTITIEVSGLARIAGEAAGPRPMYA